MTDEDDDAMEAVFDSRQSPHSRRLRNHLEAAHFICLVLY